MLALDIKDLEKTYANGVKALNGISLEVKEGDFFALLGPNGAGKSTTIGIITTLVNKTKGTVTIFNHNLSKEPEKVKECIGVVPQEFNCNIFEKVIDIVVQQAGYYGVPSSLAHIRAETYLKQLDLWDKKEHKAITLSGGMKRRLMIARALMHEPKMLILDEPTAGVDVELRRGMWDFLIKLNNRGTTIILTTHYLEEAEQLCKNIAIIDKGTIVKNTTMKSLLSELNNEIFVMDIKDPIDKVPNNTYNIKLIDETTLEVCIKKEDTLNKLFSFFRLHNINVLSMRNKTNRLEELFLRLVNGNAK